VGNVLNGGPPPGARNSLRGGRVCFFPQGTAQKWRPNYAIRTVLKKKRGGGFFTGPLPLYGEGKGRVSGGKMGEGVEGGGLFIHRVDGENGRGGRGHPKKGGARGPGNWAKNYIKAAVEPTMGGRIFGSLLRGGYIGLFFSGRENCFFSFPQGGCGAPWDSGDREKGGDGGKKKIGFWVCD